MNEPVRLRPSCSSDARLSHKWRNEPAVRRVSFQQGSIPLRHHLTWYRKALTDIITRVCVGENRPGFSIAPVRFQRTKPFVRISVVVDYRSRVRSMGSSLIQHGCHRLQAEGAVLLGGVAGRTHVLEMVRRYPISLIGNHRKRAAMSVAGRRLVDGGGTRRVAELMGSCLR